MPTQTGFKTRVVIEVFEPTKGKGIEHITGASNTVSERVSKLQEWAEDNGADITVGEQSFVTRRVTE